MPSRALIALPLLVGALLLPGPAQAAGDPSIAALQAALRARGYYAGPIDGVPGPSTTRAVRTLQRHARLTVDGIAGPKTRHALGAFGRHPFGSRALAEGAVGWDVVALQFVLAWHGFPSGSFDGGLGPHTDAALRRFQRWAGLPADGVAGPATLAALHRRPPQCPLSLAWPIRLPMSDPFGPRGNRFHTGIDIPAPAGTGVAAARYGRVAYAGFLGGGWGLLVIVNHGYGVRSFYAHLSRIDVRVGERVSAGFQVGRVGATGDATGPHLHFEVRVRGAAVDPVPVLG